MIIPITWYQKSAETVIAELQTDATTGLTRREALKRLTKYGPNVLPTKEKPPLIFKFFDEFKNLLVFILLLATIISFALGEMIDAAAIAAIVLINATIGFIQQIQAEKTLESLKQKDILFALVLREDRIEKIPFAEIVPGDVLILEEGEKVSADARVIESFSLRIDESILTGESIPVSKNPKITPGVTISLADRVNMIYKDTKILAGRGKAIVVACGKDTEIGKIALFLQTSVSEKTPLTIELEKVGQMLTLVIGVIAGLVFLLNFIHGVPVVESFLVSISLAVAAIPEGLPAIVTIVLSLGVKRLAEKKILIKKLPAVETLGAVKIIAADKTGTLTQNKINVVKIILADGRQFSVKGEGYYPKGIFIDEKKKIIDPTTYPLLSIILKIGALSSDATLQLDCVPSQRSLAANTSEKESLEPNIIGDTTEAALLIAASRAKLDLAQIKEAEPRIYEIPFSSERKMMSVIVKVNETKDHILYAKGAPEVILEKCQIDKEKKSEVLETVKQLASLGLRSLALAQKKLKSSQVKRALEEDTIEEENFEFMGVVGMQDPIRPGIKTALEQARLAGIRTIMITGDHQQTAATIAQEAGIMGKNQNVLTEEEVARFSKEELVSQIKQGINVFARISPMGKLKIIEAIKTLPFTQVAVTGDGVNDAPALSASHIGIAMGKTGTDLTREVADMIITDDNYATIVDAIREGRVIFANLVKFIRYLISCNLSEVIVIAGGVFLSTPLPLVPIQILWINLITDGLPALALGVDPPEFDVMKRPPRDLSAGILHKTRWVYMLVEGSIMGITVFLLFLFALGRFSYSQAQAMTFTALAFSQLVHAFNNRSTRKSLFRIGIFTNRPLVLAAVFSVLLQIFAVQTPLGNAIFKTEKLAVNQWLIVAAVSFAPLFVVELKKQLRFRVLP